MKKKLNTVFILITLALIGIVIFQIYWAVSAYHVNKQKFNADIDIAMQKAMDSCKKDYFDSLRVVLVKRLSAPEVEITMDTVESADTAHAVVMIWFNVKNGMFSVPLTRENAFNASKPVLEFYRKKIPHKATIPELLTEMSFYVPALAQKIVFTLGSTDISFSWPDLHRELEAHKDQPKDSVIKNYKPKVDGIYTLPPNVQQADSLRLLKYYRQALAQANVDAPFDLKFSAQHATLAADSSSYAQTNEYNYKYHGFKMFQIVGPEYFARAVFAKPGYAVAKSMVVVLILSVVLILFTIYCFHYILNLILQQKKLAELKDDFINNMTHELKTPIATITAAVEGLQNFNALDDKEKTRRYLQTSRSELERLNNLVTKVLNVAALEGFNIDMVKAPFDVDELMNDVINSETLKSAKEVAIEFQNTGSVRTLTADKMHFRNVMINLLDNAVKYCAEPVKIIVACDRKDGYAVFTVKDSGPGIAAEHLAHVFEKFYRVPTGNVHNVKGTGLGLNYVQSVIKAHGGRVTVKSEVNNGSEFIVSIPLA
jgi:signal transduction histidine kinase